MGSSPHTRGARHAAVDAGVPLGIIPAYAGSTDSTLLAYLLERDHPRIRGEHMILYDGVSSITGSSPHTRGAPHLLVGHADPRGIIPAYAGSTVIYVVVYRAPQNYTLTFSKRRSGLIQTFGLFYTWTHRSSRSAKSP